jgi:hypothetical protein
MSEGLETLKNHYELAIIGCGPAGMAKFGTETSYYWAPNFVVQNSPKLHTLKIGFVFRKSVGKNYVNVS